MRSEVLSLFLAICMLCSLLAVPAYAAGDNAVQMAQALGILDGTNLESPVTLGAVFQNAGMPPLTRTASAVRAAAIPSFRM